MNAAPVNRENGGTCVADFVVRDLFTELDFRIGNHRAMLDVLKGATVLLTITIWSTNMAKRIVESFVDDIDGSDAEGTTTFALDGTTYEIDLSGANREKLEKALAPFITKARAVRAARVRGRRGAAGSSRAISREKSAEIRRWAKSRGMPVSERGRIAATVVQQYESAH
jgi:hypothetical protein